MQLHKYLGNANHSSNSLVWKAFDLWFPPPFSLVFSHSAPGWYLLHLGLYAFFLIPPARSALSPALPFWYMSPGSTSSEKPPLISPPNLGPCHYYSLLPLPLISPKVLIITHNYLIHSFAYLFLMSQIEPQLHEERGWASTVHCCPLSDKHLAFHMGDI